MTGNPHHFYWMFPHGDGQVLWYREKETELNLKELPKDDGRHCTVNGSFKFTQSFYQAQFAL